MIIYKLFYYFLTQHCLNYLCQSLCIYLFSIKRIQLLKFWIFLKLPLLGQGLARIACSWYLQCRLLPLEIDRGSLSHPHCCPKINHFKFIQNCQHRPSIKSKLLTYFRIRFIFDWNSVIFYWTTAISKTNKSTREHKACLLVHVLYGYTDAHNYTIYINV